MKAKVLRDYPDKVTNRWHKKDEIVDFDEQRIKYLSGRGMVEILETEKEPSKKEKKKND